MFDLKVLFSPLAPHPHPHLFFPFPPATQNSLRIETDHANPRKQGKAKRNAWQAKHDELSGDAEKAKTEYVALVEKLKVEHGYDANKVPEAVGSGN